MELSALKPVDTNLTTNNTHVFGRNVDAIHDAQTPTSPENNIVLECPIEESVITVVKIEKAPEHLPATTVREIFKCYRELWKTRLSGLIVFTAAGSYYACGGSNWKEALALSTGTFLQSACANSFNEIIEIERDRIMARTKGRPLPTGRITKKHAIIQAIVVGVGGTYILYKSNNLLTAAMGAANIFLYAGVYTPLKVRSVLNTWMGTLNGSLPPLMGSSAATGSIKDPIGLFLFGTMYFWQITHFMAINYKCKSDYGRAGYKMLANENPDAAATQALLHSAFLFPLCWSLPFLNVAPWWFAALSTPVNYYYLLKPAIAFKKDVTYEKATKLFFSSLIHLSVLFCASTAAFCWKRSLKVAVVESGIWKKIVGFFIKN